MIHEIRVRKNEEIRVCLERQRGIRVQEKKSPSKPDLIKIKSLPLHIVSYPLTPKRHQAPAVTIAIHSKSKLTKGYNMGNTQLSTRQKQSPTAIATADIK